MFGFSELLMFLIFISPIIIPAFLLMKPGKAKSTIKKIYFGKIITPDELKQKLDKELKNKYKIVVKKNRLKIIQDNLKACTIALKEKNGKTICSGPYSIIPSPGIRIGIYLGFFVWFFIVIFIFFNRILLPGGFLFALLSYLFLVSISNSLSKQLLIEISDIVKKFDSISSANNRKMLLTYPIFIIIFLGSFFIITLTITSTFIILHYAGSQKRVSTRIESIEPKFFDEKNINKIQKLEYMELEEPFRQKLLDGKMIQLKVTLGYDAQNKKLQQELTLVKSEIRDIIIKHLSHLSSDYFKDGTDNSMEKLEQDFLKQINRILNNGRVERVLFNEFTLM